MSCADKATGEEGAAALFASVSRRWSSQPRACRQLRCNSGVRGHTNTRRRQRHQSPLYLLCLLPFLGWIIAPLDAVGQSKPESQTTEPKQTPAQTKAAAQEYAVPSAETIVVLIRSALLSLNDALHTGNYTVLRDVASPSFREANSVGRLNQIFSGLAAQGIDMGAVAILSPKLPQAPNIDQNRRLHIAGFFPGEPIQVNFELVFEAVANQWRLYAISVVPAKSASAKDSATPTNLPEKKKGPATSK
jgi:hypothetical protein